MSKKKSEIDNTNDSVKEFVDSLLPMIKEVQKLQKQHLKQLTPIVHNAITSKILDYISTFNPETAKWYREYDKEMNGIYDPVIEVASEMAMNFHAGQKDKAGIDYFEGHLTFVGNAGGNWKEKITGFLHDVAEDTPHTVEEIMQTLKARSNGVLGEEDAREIETALNLLNSTTATSREEYIARIKNSSLATIVKLNDLKHNMDISRIPDPTQKDLDRLARYEKEYIQILGYLEPSDMLDSLLTKNYKI